MKLMLIRQWTDMSEILLSAMAPFSCPAMEVGETLNRKKLSHQPFGARPYYVMGLQLLAGLGLSTASAMAQEIAEPPRLDNAVSWNLTDTIVVSKGQVDVMKEGEFAHDLIIESKATATNPSGSVIPAGTFKLVMSAFSPAYDQRGQKQGIWYVWGKWTLTDVKASPSGNGKQRAGEISGQISAELAFNPVVTPKNWTAKIRLPMTRNAPVSQAGSQPARGEGALTMDSKREGNMSLNLRLWPQMQYK